MKKKSEVYLIDMLRSISKIEKYIKGMTSKSFQQDEKTYDAVLRNIEIIGEASNRLSTAFLNKNPDFPHKEAVSMRNLLIHEYDKTDTRIVWKTLKEDIPLLKNKILQILKLGSK